MTCRLTHLFTILAGLSAAAAAQSDRDVLRSRGIEPTVEGVRVFFRRLEPGPEQRARIEWLIARLGDPRYRVREDAQRQLRQVGFAAQSELALAMESDNAERARRAEEIRSNLESESGALLNAALSVLERAKSDEYFEDALRAVTLASDPRVLDRIADLLAKSADRHVELLVEQLRSPMRARRQVAVRALGTCEAPAATQAMREALDDREPQIRIEAAVALIRRGDRAALGTLVDLLAEQDISIRARAASILTSATGQAFDYAAYDESAAREAAIARWRDWLARDGGTTELRPPGEWNDEDRPVLGFVFSCRSGGVVRADRQGRSRKVIAAKPYDVCEVGDGRLAIVERDAGRVRLLAADDTELRILDGLKSPNDVEVLPNGNLLVVEGGANRVAEYDPDGNRVWSVGGLSTPFDALRLPNGNTLVADSGNDRVVEFSPARKIVWQGRGVDFPNGVTRSADGDTVVTTYTTGTVACLGPDGRVRWATKVGGTVYSPRFAEGHVFVADGNGNRILKLDRRGRPVETIVAPKGFNDVDYVLGR